MKKPLTNRQVYRYLLKELKGLVTVSGAIMTAGVFSGQDAEDTIREQNSEVYDCAERLLAFINEQKVAHGNVVIGEEIPGVTNIMVAATYAQQRKRNKA